MALSPHFSGRVHMAMISALDTATRRLLLAAMTGVLALGITARANGAECSVQGDPIQWIADYCMLEMQTDDEIAAGDCIEKRLRRAPRDACEAKRRTKEAMCALAIDRSLRSGSVEACVTDPAFVGPIVAKGGVGA
jgi:hypothetical protein